MKVLRSSRVNLQLGEQKGGDGSGKVRVYVNCADSVNRSLNKIRGQLYSKEMLFLCGMNVD